MKYALVNNIKSEASKGVKGICPNCGSELIAHCGDVKVNHWAHKKIRNCDIWWENETEWHRYWKNQFPFEWQEIVHTSKNGEKHISDVKTDEEWVLEFQYSPIKLEEKHSRNVFYSKIVWVINGIRRERDKKQFHNILKESTKIKWGRVIIYRTAFPEESKLINEWQGNNVPVFFDFQESSNLQQSRLWLLIPFYNKKVSYLLAFSSKILLSFTKKKDLTN